jgi:hypothetical protein
MPNVKICNQFYLFPFSVLGIIMFVDTAFLMLVAAPLAIYLIILVFSLQDIKDETAPADVHADTTVEVDETAPEPETTTEHTSAFAASTQQSWAPERVSETRDADELPNAVAGSASASAFSEAAVPAAMTAPAETVSDETLENTALHSDAPVQEAVSAPSVPIAPPPEHTTVEMIITPSATDEQGEKIQDDENIEELLDTDGPLLLPGKGSPKFTFDYRGRLWVEKKRKSFFRQLRRPQLPPDEPESR